jgi:hypothetical protein
MVERRNAEDETSGAAGERNATARESQNAPDSSVGRTAKEQRASGASGGPQASREEPRTPKQPPQTSNRRGKVHEHEPNVRRGYEAAQDPERQGDGDPGPDQVRERSSVQGFGSRNATGQD